MNDTLTLLIQSQGKIPQNTVTSPHQFTKKGGMGVGVGIFAYKSSLIPTVY
jgi:hypothetical protein